MTTKTKGLICAIVGTTFWGMSGCAAQFLFSRQPVEPGWLVGVRLLISGVLLLGWSAITTPKQVMTVWHHKRDGLLLIAFALFGMVPSQFSYFMAVKYGNAPTATILQFLGPLFIIIYLAIANWQLPRRIDAISMVIALFGTYLLVTKGQFTSLQLAPPAIFWGVMAGVGQALYTLIPIHLLKTFDAKIVTGWAMLIGSVAFLPHLLTTPLPNLPAIGWAGVFFVATVGTMFAYLLYLQSLKYLKPSTTGMLSSFEPFTATVLSVVLLHTAFGLPEAFGGVMILATAFLQALAVNGLPRWLKRSAKS